MKQTLPSTLISPWGHGYEADQNSPAKALEVELTLDAELTEDGSGPTE